MYRRLAWLTLLCLAWLVGCRPKVDSGPADGDGPTNVQRSNPFADVAKTGKAPADGLSTNAPGTGDSKPGQPRVPAFTNSLCSTFRDVATDRRLAFTYRSGQTGKLLMVESMGGGAGWLDFDGDHRWDLYLTQGGQPDYRDPSKQPNDALWRALPDGSFQDVTEFAGVHDLYYSQGVTIGDYDDDGFDDIYVLNYGRNTLLKNLGDGTFQDVTEAAGIGDERWSSSGAWGDLDGDGDLDLYVCNYCNYDTRNPPDCSKDGKPHICHPREVPPVPDECYINQGDGTFTAEAKRRGLFGDGNRGLGVVIFDFDQDGDADVYVANDMTPNFLFVNDGTGLFKESAMQLGCAVDRNGSPQASMGLACGDYDGDGWLDLYSTHFQFDSNTLYRNLGAGPAGFQDVTGLVGLHSPTLPYLAFGTVMVDFNRDTRQELFVANGHLEPVLVEGKTVFEMNAQLFAFDGRRFQECTKSAGDYFAKKWIARGVAVCDINDDGAADLCVVHQDAPTALLENTSQFGHGLTLRFRGLAANRRGVGVQVRVTAGGKTYFQELCGGTSYASSHQPALFFGLGEFSGECDVEVRWPTGETQKLTGVSVDQSLVVEQSRGR